MAYHEAFWVATSAAAPVLALAHAVIPSRAIASILSARGELRAASRRTLKDITQQAQVIRGLRAALDDALAMQQRPPASGVAEMDRTEQRLDLLSDRVAGIERWTAANEKARWSLRASALVAVAGSGLATFALLFGIYSLAEGTDAGSTYWGAVLLVLSTVLLMFESCCEMFASIAISRADIEGLQDELKPGA